MPLQWNKIDGYIKARFTPLSSTSTYPIDGLPDEFVGFIQSTMNILTRYQIHQGASDADITSLIMSCRRFLDLYGTLSNVEPEHSFLSYTSARADAVDSAFAQLSIQNVFCSVHIHNRLQRSYNIIFFRQLFSQPISFQTYWAYHVTMYFSPYHRHSANPKLSYA